MGERHSLLRTSPKGPRQRFIGTCMKCGIPNLTLDDASECVNPAGLNNDETLHLAIRGPRSFPTTGANQ